MKAIVTLLLLALGSTALAQEEALERREQTRERREVYSAEEYKARREQRLAAWKQASAEKEKEVRSVTYVLNGKEVTRFFAMEEGENGVLRLIETQTPGGRSINTAHEYWRTGDQSATVEHTGPQGQTASTDIEWLMSELGFVVSKETTGPNGRTASSENVLNRTEDGISSDRTVIGPDGRVYAIDTDYWKTKEGVERARTSTGPNGQQILSKDTWARNEEGGWTRSGETQTSWGSSFTRNREGAREGNTVTIDGSRERTGRPDIDRSQIQGNKTQRGERPERSQGQRQGKSRPQRTN